MATRGLRKVIKRIIMNAQEKDVNKRTFNPQEYSVNWNNAIKYLNARDRRLTFNKIFKPLFADIYLADVKAYLAGGHKLTTKLQKEMRAYAKTKAKDLTQAQIKATPNPPEPSYKEQEELLPEG